MIKNDREKSIIYLREIKSCHIVKKVFSFLERKRKLNIIIYNKEFQKIILVDLKDYKKISKKYKIGDKNGKGKEYNYRGILLFEGEYYRRYLITPSYLKKL